MDELHSSNTLPDFKIFKNVIFFYVETPNQLLPISKSGFTFCFYNS